MKKVAKLTYREQVLWALKEHTKTDPASALTVREAIEKTGVLFNQSSHSAAMVGIWKRFGNVEGGVKLFDRVKKKGAGYAYYKAKSEVDQYKVEDLKYLYPHQPEEAQAPAKETATAATPAPGTLNVNLNVTWDINLNFNGLKGLFK